MTTAPVTPARITKAYDLGFVNVSSIAEACRLEDVPFFAALALFSKESPDRARAITGGANIYGHDKGGTFTVPGSLEVTPANFGAFLIYVVGGAVSNGVGPSQLTYAGGTVNGHRDGGYFRQMLEENLLPWVPLDNMRKGLRILAGNLKATGGSYAEAGGLYNGGPKWRGIPAAIDYGVDLAARVAHYKPLILAAK